MKKVIPICILAIFYSLYPNFKGFAQKVIDLDFQNQSDWLKNKKTLRHDTVYVFKIKNVNRNLYKIENSTTQTAHNTEVPSIFKDVSLPSFISLKTPNKEYGKEVDDQQKGRNGLEVMPLAESFQNKLELIESSFQRIKEAEKYNRDLKRLTNACDNTFDILRVHKSTLTGKFLREVEPLDTAKALIDIMENSIKKALNDYSELEKIYYEYATVLKGEVAVADAAIKKLEADTANGGNPIKLSQTRRDKVMYEILLEQIKAALANAKLNVDALQNFQKENNVIAIADNFKLLAEENFTYTSSPIKIKKDITDVIITIKSEKPLPCNKPLESFFVGKYYTKGGFKIDFSTGLFINGSSNPDFYGNDFYYKQIDDSFSIIQTKDAGKRAMLSFGALAHFYWRTGLPINFAISPGLSTTTNFDGLNFHLGGSLLIGRKDRFVITGGLTLRETKILDKNYVLGNHYLSNQLPEAPPTVKMFPKAGWFISLSYNLSSIGSGN